MNSVTVSKIQLVTGCNYQKAKDLHNLILNERNAKYQQLEQVARQMFYEYADISGTARGEDAHETIEHAEFCLRRYRKQLEALGVSVDK